MNEFFNSLSNGLYELDLSLHNTKLKDTLVDNFIHELRNYLAKSDVTYRLSKLPQDTLLDINEIEKIIFNVILIMKNIIFQMK